MDRHLTFVLLTAVLLAVGVMPGTATNGSAQMEDGDSMGRSVSSFMQVSSVEADSTIDREMWESAFSNADNESEKAALIKQRSKQLSEDLSAVHTRREQLENGSLSQAYTDALNAHVTELRQSIQNTSQTANESNVNSSNLSGLRKKACNVSVSNDSQIIVNPNGTGLQCPPQSPGSTPTNNTSETPPDTDGPTNNTTETPPVPGNNTTETPPVPGNNTTETPPVPGNNTTETPQNPGDSPSNTTETPQNPGDPPSNTTETPEETESTTTTEMTNDSGTILNHPLQSNRSSSVRPVDGGRGG